MFPAMTRKPIDVGHLFTYHPPTPDQVPKFEAITEAARNFAQVIVDNCPESDRTERAVDKIIEARMAANAAIALESSQARKEHPMKPTVGRQVFFRMTENDYRPATIVEVFDEGTHGVNLQVFFDGLNDRRHIHDQENDGSPDGFLPSKAEAEAGMGWRTSVAEGTDVGEWSWNAGAESDPEPEPGSKPATP